MTYLRLYIVCRYLLAFFVLMSALNVNSGESEITNDIASGIEGYSHQKSIDLGEQIYRKGIRPDGNVATAFVQSDIFVDGQIFTCELCHRRSGLGTSEGYVVALPINGHNLFRPRVLWDSRRRHSRADSHSTRSRQIPSYFLGKDLRPAYTDLTLEQAIHNGVDPTGRKLNHIMPRYDFSDKDLSLLMYYLKNLTFDLSPGVTEEKLHFATIVTDGVIESDKDAMLNVLNTYVRSRNAQTRNQLKRAQNGVFNKRELDASYRLLELSVWELKGSRDTWKQQLEQYYKNAPVFAILGSIVEGDWAPIQKFTESNKIPVIFPITDQPVVSTDDWYTVYFSKGLYQEGESTARYLNSKQSELKVSRIIQVYKRGSRGEVIAKGFNETWKHFDVKPVEIYEIQGDEVLDKKFLQNVSDLQNDVIVLFWGNNEDIISADIFNQPDIGRINFFVSSTLLNDEYPPVLKNLRDQVYVTYPYSLPGDKKRNIAALKTWLKINGIPATNINVQAKMYFLVWLLSDIFNKMKSEFYRDYFVENIEMMKDQTHSISAYPRLSLGPNQRYASKGCYIVQLSKDADQTMLKKSDWIVH